MTREEAKQFILFMVKKLDGGYHPDNDLSEYVYRVDGVITQSFTDEEIRELQPKHDEACAVLGDDVYQIAMDMLDTPDKA